MSEWEYGIILTSTDDLHRTGLTRRQALDWVSGWILDGGNANTFHVVRRSVGPWMAGVATHTMWHDVDLGDTSIEMADRARWESARELAAA